MTSPSSIQQAALSERAMALAGKRAFIFDYDGTLVRGDVLIPGTVEGLEWLRLKGYDLAVVSNNSFLDTSELHQRLVRHGFPVVMANVHTAVSVAADEAVRRAPRRRVVCAGSAGLAAALERRGLTLVTSDADVVVTGMDRDLTYDKLTSAVEAVLAGAVFVAVNMDRLLVDADRIGPGGGVVAAAVQYATGRAPDVVAGKPSTHLLVEALAGLGRPVAEACIVGDNPASDVAAGRNLSMTTVLVTTGVTPSGTTADDGPRADIELASAADLPAVLSFQRSPKRGASDE
jgi:4-nitrophenyl phosphatase